MPPDPIASEMQACKHRKTKPKRTVELENKIQPSTRELNYATWMDAYLCDVQLSFPTSARGGALRVRLSAATKAEARLGCAWVVGSWRCYAASAQGRAWGCVVQRFGYSTMEVEEMQCDGWRKRSLPTNDLKIGGVYRCPSLSKVEGSETDAQG